MRLRTLPCLLALALPYAALLGFVFFGEQPSASLWLGAALIVAASENKLSPEEVQRVRMQVLRMQGHWKGQPFEHPMELAHG